jgi:hypothetical protein
MKIIYNLTLIDFIRKSLFLFIKFYLLFFIITAFITGISNFSLFFPIIIFLIFILTNQILLEVYYNDNTKIYVTTLKFIFFKSKKEYFVHSLSYTLQEEFTSRLTRGDVFRIYYKDCEIFKRNNQLDGLTDEDVSNIINEFKMIGINKNEL